MALFTDCEKRPEAFEDDVLLQKRMQSLTISVEQQRSVLPGAGSTASPQTTVCLFIEVLSASTRLLLQSSSPSSSSYHPFLLQVAPVTTFSPREEE